MMRVASRLQPRTPMIHPTAYERPETPLFSDGLGDRVVAVDGGTGDLLQILRLRPQLLAVPSFEFALRERAARLTNFRHAYYARVRRVDRHPGGLAIVSDHVEGTRLSDILRVAAERRLQLDLNAALCLIRQLVPAVALLHENARDVAHGTIAAERLIVTPHARVVIAEHVVGSAVEQLQFNRERLWRELRVAVPPTAGPPRFDHRADVTAIGLIALALVLGRPLRADDYPQRAAVLLSAATARSTMGEEQPLPASLRTWIARALQLDPRHGFASAVEAQTAFEEVLREDSGFVAAPVALETFLSRYISALLEPGHAETAFAIDLPAPSPAAAAPPASAQPERAELEALKAEFVEALAEKPEPRPVQTATAAPASPARLAPATAAPAQTRIEPAVEATPVASEPRRAERLAADAPIAAPPAESRIAPVGSIAPSTAPTPIKPKTAPEPVAPAVASTSAATTDLAAARVIDPPDITELLRSLDPAPIASAAEPIDTDAARMFGSDANDEAAAATGSARKRRGARWRRAAVIAVVAVAFGEGALLALRSSRKTNAPTEGTLSVQTNPPGVAVFVDGLSRGNTPARLSLGAGSHIVELRGRGVPRVIPVNVTAGAEVSQYLELPETPSAGSLLVQSDPPGARVTVDGIEHGVAPVSVADLAPGDHEVVLQAAGGAAVKQRVVIQAGVTSSVLAPVAAVQGPVSGWLAVKVPVMMEIREGGRLLGTTDSERLMMSAGRHEIELVNDTLGYRATKVVQVPPGKVAAVPVELPQGTVNINALPWAEVWIDGKRVGETPIGNLAVTIGPHEIVFRHPQFGEKKQAASVTMHAPVRLSVDMK